jgi:hypothetical protein
MNRLTQFVNYIYPVFDTALLLTLSKKRREQLHLEHSYIHIHGNNKYILERRAHIYVISRETSGKMMRQILPEKTNPEKENIRDVP